MEQLHTDKERFVYSREFGSTSIPIGFPKFTNSKFNYERDRV